MAGQIFTWGAVVVGYLIPSIALGFGLGPAAGQIERWGRSATTV